MDESKVVNSIIFRRHLAAAVLLAVIVSGCSKPLLREKGILETVAHNHESLEMLFGIGRLSERNGKPLKAIEAYQTILKDHPDHTNTLHRLGVIDAKRGLTDSAIQWLQKAVQSGPPSPELLGDLGYAYYLAGDLESANTYLNEGLARDPEDARMLNNLAIVCGAEREYDRAMNLFRQSGTEAEALASLAYIQSQNGNLTEAKASYLDSLDLDGSLEVAANGLIELQKSYRGKSAGQDVQPSMTLPSSVQLASYHEADDSIVRSVKPKDTMPSRAFEAQPSQRKIDSVEPVIDDNTLPQVKARLRGPGQTKVGQATSFVIVIENDSTQEASDIEIELTMEDAMSISDVTREAWHDDSKNVTTWKYPRMAGQETDTIRFEAKAHKPGKMHHRLTVIVGGQSIGELSLETEVIR